VSIYDTAGPAQQAPRILSGVGAVNCLQCDGNKIVAGFADHTLKVWDMNTFALRHNLADHTGPVHAVQFDSQKVFC
jgi:WD40 repeat protein